MDIISVVPNDIVNAFREAKAHLKNTLQERGIERVAVWGCSESGEILLQLLDSSGIQVEAVYDGFRRGQFRGRPILDPYRDLVQGVPVIIASSRPAEDLREISEYLASKGTGYFFTDSRYASAQPLARFMGIHRDQRCFIVGNGPSLNRINMARLRDEITLGSNRVYHGFGRWGFHFNYWAIEDRLVAEDIRDEWDRMEGPVKFIPGDLLHLAQNRQNLIPVKFARKPFLPGMPLFSDDPGVLYWGGTVTYLLFQLAAIMGCNPIYLVGVDFHYVRPDHVQALDDPRKWISQGDDPNHFFPEYFGAGRKWHDPDLDRARNCYQSARAFFDARGVRVFNATPGSRLDVFERIEFESIFA